MIGTPLDESRMQRLGAEGIDVLVVDSTTPSARAASLSERDVAKSLGRYHRQGQTGVLRPLTTFSSNVARSQGGRRAARAAGRQLVVRRRALHRVIQVAIETATCRRASAPTTRIVRISRSQRDQLLCRQQPRARCAPRSARIAEEERPEISFNEGDLVMFLAHHSRRREGRGRTQNESCTARVRYLTDGEAFVHVWGTRGATSCGACMAGSSRAFRADARRAAPLEGAGGARALVRCAGAFSSFSMARSRASRPTPA